VPVKKIWLENQEDVATFAMIQAVRSVPDLSLMIVLDAAKIMSMSIHMMKTRHSASTVSITNSLDLRRVDPETLQDTVLYLTRLIKMI
jgi:hypothetical protein